MTQTVDRGGERWRVQLTYNNLSGDDKAALRAFLVRLNGQEHRLRITDESLIQRGALSGTPLVNGAAQTGSILAIDGCGNNVTNWIRAGDMFGVDGRLKMAVLDASSDGLGELSLTFKPRILTAPPTNDPIIVSAPTGVFILEGNSTGWPNRPGDFSDFTIQCIEDIVA